jgi:hypothetical protein
MAGMGQQQGHADRTVNGSGRPAESAQHAGLCARCRFSRRIVSGRGSVFLLCERSRHDARFRKYPALPVASCPGFEAIETAKDR